MMLFDDYELLGLMLMFMTSAIFFTIGFVIGKFVAKHEKKKESK